MRATGFTPEFQTVKRASQIRPLPLLSAQIKGYQHSLCPWQEKRVGKASRNWLRGVPSGELTSENPVDFVSSELVVNMSFSPRNLNLYLRPLLTMLCVASAVSAGLSNAATSDSVRQTYSPADFAQFAPRSALDLVQQVPGFSINEGDGNRGFGQADTNLLINGRRISGKSNGPRQALERLSVESVIRLEVLDGASLDIGGMSGQVLNVVTASDSQLTGRYSYSPRIRPTGASSEERWREFSVAVTGGSENSEWTMNIANEQRAFGDSGPEIVSDSTGNAIEFRQEKRLRFFDRPNLSGSYSRQTEAGNVFNIVGEINGFYSDETETSQRAEGTPDENTRELKQSEDEYNFEIGADYEFAVGAGQLKLMALHRFEHSPTLDRADTRLIEGRIEGSRFDRIADEAESIVRTEYGFTVFDSQWRWAIEGAENYLDIDGRLAERNSQGDFVPVALEGASSRVEETRAETTLNFTRKLNEKITLQTTIGAEYSEIRQSGSRDVVRDFLRPKGFVSLNWKPNDVLFLSAKLERYVGQLRFFDFIASVDVNQEREDVTNVNLVPPQSWFLELEAQTSLGKVGSATFNLFYEDIEDIVDRIPIEGGGQAPGNIDSAERYGGSFDATLLSDDILWKGGRADLSFAYSNSSVLDPILGTNRAIGNDFSTSYRLDLRQDFEQSSWAIGGAIDYNETYPSVRIDEVSFYNQSPEMVNFYVENKDVFGLTVRANLWNLLGAKNRLERTIFNDRLTGDVAFTERRSRSFGYSYTLTIEGTF